MTGFRNHRNTLASIGLALTGALGVTSLQGCDEGGICGPCGSVLEGSVGISGSAQLDGFFSAVATIGSVTGSIQGEFDANIRALAEVWGFAEIEGDINAQVVTDLMAHIRGEINGAIGVNGGISIEYAGPKCSASASIAVEASADCEVQAGCDCEVMVDPGEVSVSCEGTCSGECSGSCEGSVSCSASAMGGGFECEGSCTGSCALEVGGMCEGTCNGSCDGACSVDSDPDSPDGCEGECSGMCTGTCELTAGGSCSGECNGECVVEAPSADFDCNGTPPKCEGSCSADCSGSCEGTARPPSASASCECDAKADCEASASAQASANIECTPPSLEISFQIDAMGSISGDIGAEAAFRAKLGELRIRGVAILQGFAQMGALINGKVDGELVFDPPPLVDLTAQFKGVIDAAASGEFDIAPGRIDCVVPALREAAGLLVTIGQDTGGTISAQAEFSTSLFGMAG